MLHNLPVHFGNFLPNIDRPPCLPVASSAFTWEAPFETAGLYMSLSVCRNWTLNCGVLGLGHTRFSCCSGRRCGLFMLISGFVLLVLVKLNGVDGGASDLVSNSDGWRHRYRCCNTFSLGCRCNGREYKSIIFGGWASSVFFTSPYILTGAVGGVQGVDNSILGILYRWEKKEEEKGSLRTHKPIIFIKKIFVVEITRRGPSVLVQWSKVSEDERPKATVGQA
jgi:hypothetical protein